MHMILRVVRRDLLVDQPSNQLVNKVQMLQSNIHDSNIDSLRDSPDAFIGGPTPKGQPAAPVALVVSTTNCFCLLYQF